jgi:hypothetical protein
MSSGDETELEEDAIKRRRSESARKAKDAKKQTEKARLAKFARASEEIEEDAAEAEFWKDHEISKDDFEPLSGAVSLYNAAILVRTGLHDPKEIASLCEVAVAAIPKAIEFLRLQELRQPNVDDEKILEDFEIWFQFAFKRGRKILEPLTMLRIHKSLKHKVQIEKNATCTKSCHDFIRLIVSPAIQEEKTASALNNLIEDEGETLSQSAQKRLWNLFNQEDYITSGKKSIKSRQDAQKNPLGALSLAAGWAWIIKNLALHPKSLVFVDAMAHLANHSTHRLGFIKGKLPAGTKQLMRDEGWTPVYDRADVSAERCFSIDVGMGYGIGLIFWTVHVYDITIKEITKTRVSKNGFVMFEPYSQASIDALARGGHAAHAPAGGQAAQAPAGGQAAQAPAGGQAAQETSSPESLAQRVADRWTAEVLIPMLQSHREALQEEARLVQMDPELFKNILLTSDGESTHMNALLDHFVARMADAGLVFAKGPAALSGCYAVPDVAKNFVLMHALFIDLMNTLTEEQVVQHLVNEPGMTNAIDVLMRTGMSAAHKETFRRLLAITPSIVASSVTPAIVNKGFKDAGLWPIDDVKIVSKCFPTFKTMNQSDAQALMQCVRGPLSELFGADGMLEPSKMTAIVRRDVPAVIFPEKMIEDDAVLNRHGFVNLSHPYVLEKYEARVMHDSAVRIEQAEKKDSKAVRDRKRMVRMSFCLAENGQPSATTEYKFKCKCGKLFASITAFDSHEKIAAHRTMFGSRDWEVDYEAAGIRQAEVAAAEIPQDGEAPVSDSD